MPAPQVLMVDDNRNDLELGELAFNEIGMKVQFIGVQDPEAAVVMLRALALDARAVLPRLILLDLNMPRVLGVEILAFIKSDPRLNKIPVVVLTTSNAQSDRDRCLSLGANEYQVKPFRLDAYLELFTTFRRYLEGADPGGPTSTTIGGSDPFLPRPADSSSISRRSDLLSCCRLATACRREIAEKLQIGFMKLDF